MTTRKERRHVSAGALGICCVLALAHSTGRSQEAPAQALDANGVPIFRVDPFWPKPLPNKWSMQQVTGLQVDHMDHIWFLNRGAAAEGDEIGGGDNPPRIDCCVRGPEVIELDQEGTVVHAWGGPGYHPLWPTALQTVIADRKGFVWVGGTAAQDSILKFTRDGKFVWDFGHRPPQGAQTPEKNQQTDILVSKGRFQLDEIAQEIYIINWKRVLVYDMNTGAFKRGWGAYGIPLSQIDNGPLPVYTLGSAPAKQFLGPVHCIRLSRDGFVYVCDRTSNRIQVFAKDGKFVKEFFVRKETLGNGSTWTVNFSSDPQQRYLLVGDGRNNVIWMVNRNDGTVAGSLGHNGRNAGQFHWVHQVVLDSQGNMYTGEVDTGKRIQKFILQR